MLFRSKNITPEEKFWKWFSKNSKKLIDIDGGEIIRLISTELRKYDEGLVELVSHSSTRPRELFISADGRVSKIDAVERLCDAAPSVPGWKILRFRPRFPDAGNGISYEDVKIDTDGVQFVAYLDEPKIGLDIYAHWRKPEEGTDADGPTFVMLDHTIGEYEVMCGIGSIEVHPLEQAPEHAKPWSAFAKLFDDNWARES